MRRASAEELLTTVPPELRLSSKIAQAYLGIRAKILKGDYQPDHIIVPSEVEEEYHTNNTSVQTALMRLAMEGLIKVLPVKKKTRRTNAAVNEYHVADLSVRHRMFSTRHGDFVEDITHGGHPMAHKETLLLEVEYADKEVAELLNIQEGEKLVHHRNLQKRDNETVVCINDSYLPFWFVEILPELKKPDNDIYQLMTRLGKKPFWCTETVDIVQANTVERMMFGLSIDDPAPLFKILRRSFDENGHPLEVQFLTDRGDVYRLHYSFPLFVTGIPETVRKR